jgi:hypothetical protein
MVVAFVERAVTGHRPDIDMLVGQLLQTVVVNIQLKAQHTKDKNRPQAHATATSALVNIWCNPRLKQLEYCRAHRHLHVQVLQSFQNLGDIIA